jgi:hypothetical protein
VQKAPAAPAMGFSAAMQAFHLGKGHGLSGMHSHLSTDGLMMVSQMEGTMTQCHTYLIQLSKIGEPKAKAEIVSAEEGGGPRKKRIGVAKELTSKIQWRNDPKFKALLAEMESQHSRGLTMHPKMEVLRDLLINYFGQRMPNEDVDDEDVGASNAMIFCNSRGVVEEIVEMLNEHRPLIRASTFIGHGLDNQGKKGMAQKVQLEVCLGGAIQYKCLFILLQTIQKFQANELNVLVATCIGEEGLDIGEVDLIVCYDAQKTPIRMVGSSMSSLMRLLTRTSSCNDLVAQDGNATGRSTFFLLRTEKSSMWLRPRLHTRRSNEQFSMEPKLNCMGMWSAFYQTISNRNAWRKKCR